MTKSVSLYDICVNWHVICAFSGKNETHGVSKVVYIIIIILTGGAAILSVGCIVVQFTRGRPNT